jgi:hypothetical protein
MQNGFLKPEYYRSNITVRGISSRGEEVKVINDEKKNG